MDEPASSLFDCVTPLDMARQRNSQKVLALLKHASAAHHHATLLHRNYDHTSHHMTTTPNRHVPPPSSRGSPLQKQQQKVQAALSKRPLHDPTNLTSVKLSSRESKKDLSQATQAVAEVSAVHSPSSLRQVKVAQKVTAVSSRFGPLLRTMLYVLQLLSLVTHIINLLVHLHRGLCDNTDLIHHLEQLDRTHNCMCPLHRLEKTFVLLLCWLLVL